METYFISHNGADKDLARKIASALTLLGKRVWFDEWKIDLGDSIPAAIDQGLAEWTTFVLIWSKAASESQWVLHEANAAFVRKIARSGTRMVPIVLDSTEIPPLLSSMKYLDARSGLPAMAIARDLVGIKSDSAVRSAVQATLDELGWEMREFHGAGILLACRECGAPATDLEGWHSVDHDNDRSYAGARCPLCGWEAGGEI